MRFKQMEEERETEKNKWLMFSSKVLMNYFVKRSFKFAYLTFRPFFFRLIRKECLKKVFSLLLIMLMEGWESAHVELRVKE